MALVVLVNALALAAALWFASNLRSIHRKPVLRQVWDMTERFAEIPSDPQRILSMCSSATDTIVRLGEGDKILAIDEYNRIIPGLNKTTVIGKGSIISQEQILSLGIDLAFVWWYQDAAAAMLEGLSVPVIRIRSGRAEEVPHMIRLVGECLNKSMHAEQLAADVAEYVLASSAEKIKVPPKPRVYLELYGAFNTVGKDTYIDDLLGLAGAENIADEASGSMLLSAEKLIMADPDIILFVKDFQTIKSISERSGMAKIAAIQNRRVYPIDRYWLVSGAGLPEAVKSFRETLTIDSYPNLEK